MGCRWTASDRFTTLREWRGVGSAFPKHTTPAKAGAQLGDVANDAQFAVTATFPIGPRPPPGWCIWIGKD